MIADSMVECVKGWCFLLSGIWGVVLLPFACAVILDKKKRGIRGVILVSVGLFFIILGHDLNAHFKGRRTWVPFYEWFFGLAFPREGAHVILVDVPLSNCTTNISHYWRGNYGITVWVPNSMWKLSEEDHRSLDHDIMLSGFISGDRGRHLVDFQSVTNQTKKSEWGPESGGSTIHYEYDVPTDLPLDDVLSVRIFVSGDKRGFLSRFPDARLRIEKLCDK